MVDEQTGRVVDKDHKGRGYELSKGKYVEIEEEELDAVKLESTHTIEIDDFVPAEDIDERYLDKPYYIGPNEGRRRRIRGHSRCHEAKGQGGACACGAFKSGACHRTEAAGQRLVGNDAALSLRIEG